MRPLHENEREHVDELLLRAEALITDRIPRFDDLVSYSSPNRLEGFVRRVVHITSDAVARVFRNPSAFRQETEGNYSYTLDKAAASGLLTIEPEEWLRLGIDTYGDNFTTQSTLYDGYISNRSRPLRETRPDLVFQNEFPGDQPGMADDVDWANIG